MQYLKYFGYTINLDKSEIDLKQKVLLLGLELDPTIATIRIKSKMKLLL